MLSKLLGVVAAGVFVGAAALEILGLLNRPRSPGKRRAKAQKAHTKRNQTAPQVEG